MHNVAARLSAARTLLIVKEETIYVVAGSDAEEHVARRFPHKQTKRVGNGLRTSSIPTFLRGLHLAFQPGKAAELDAVYHFTFIGKEAAQATIVIRNGTLQVQDGHQGEPDLRVVADSEMCSASWRESEACCGPFSAGRSVSRDPRNC